MWFRALSSLWASRSADRTARRRPVGPRLTLLELGDRTLPAAVTLGAVGDSYTAPYTTDPVIPGVLEVQGEYNWVDQLRAARPGEITIFDEAIIGETSTQLLADQLPAVTDLAADGAIRYAVVETGTADALFQFGRDILRGKPEGFVNTVVANVKTAVETLARAGDVHLVVADIPDVTVTPYFLANVTSNHTHSQRMSDAIRVADEQIIDFATSRGIPVVDLDGLFRLTRQPLTLGGVTLGQPFTPDGLHPRTPLQGLLADTVLEALRVGYGEHTDRLRLSDQEILDAAGSAHDPGRTFFDVRPFVILGGGSHTAVLSAEAATPAAGEAGGATRGGVGVFGGCENGLSALIAGVTPRENPPTGSSSEQPIVSNSGAVEQVGGEPAARPAANESPLDGVGVGDPATSFALLDPFDDQLGLMPGR